MEKLSTFWTEPIVKPSAKIGFSDVEDKRIIEAVSRIRSEGWASPVLIEKLSIEKRHRYGEVLAQHRHQKPDDVAPLEESLTEDSLYVGIAMLLMGEIDALIAGSLRPTSDVVKAALHFVGAKSHRTLVSGQFLVESEAQMMAHDGPYLFADCAVMPEPSARSLATIAIEAAESYEFFTRNVARVALLSFSTRGSADHPLVDRIREACAIAKKMKPDLNVDGELQADAALFADVAKIKNADDSSVAGQANVLVFPTLEAGNLAYKLVQRFSSARVAGPLLWGLSRPMSDLSRGCTIQEIVDTARVVCRMTGGVH